MPELIHPRERDRLLARLRRLRRRARVDGRPLPGLARDDSPGAPLATLDNALAAEALALPALREAEPAMAEEALAFVLAMAEEPGPPARGARPEGLPETVEVERDDPRSFRLLTPWHRLEGDLSRGVLRQWLRDGPEEAPWVHTGHMLRLRPASGWPALAARLGLGSRTLDVEEAIVAQGVLRQGEDVLLFHESALRPRPLRRPPLSWRAGTLRYEWRISAADPVLRLTVTLRAEAALTGLRATTALDDLSRLPAPLAADALAPDGPRRRTPALWTAAEESLAEGPLLSLRLRAAGPAWDAPALHLRPRAPEAVRSARVRTREGRAHWLVLRHDWPDLPAGGAATLREDRLLLRGADPSAPEGALRLLRDPGALSGRDPGRAPPGASLAAVAAALPGAGPRAPRLRAWLEDRLALALPEDAPPPADAEAASELALALRAQAALARDGGASERSRLRRGLARLAGWPDEHRTEDPLPALGHALLALTRAAALLEEPAAEAAARRALGAALAAVPAAGDAPTVALAALLRGVRAARESLPLPEDEAERAEAAEGALLAALSARIEEGEGWLAVHPGPGSRSGSQSGSRSGSGPGEAGATAAALLATLSPP